MSRKSRVRVCALVLLCFVPSIAVASDMESGWRKTLRRAAGYGKYMDKLQRRARTNSSGMFLVSPVPPRVYAAVESFSGPEYDNRTGQIIESMTMDHYVLGVRVKTTNVNR